MTFNEIISALGLKKRINSSAFLKSIDDKEIARVGHVKRLTESANDLADRVTTVETTLGTAIATNGLYQRVGSAVTATGTIATMNCGANDFIRLTSTTSADKVRLSNSVINDGHIISFIYVAEAAGGDEIVLSKLNAGDGVGFTTITFSTVGNTATLQWSSATSKWYVLSVNGAVVA
jgi:hypothetical protein